MRGGFWAGLLAASVVLTSGVGRAQCTKDTDCKGERICEAGQCTAPAVAPKPPVATASVTPEQPPQNQGERTRFFDDEREGKPRRIKKRIKNPALLAGGITSASLGLGLLVYGVLASAQCNAGDLSPPPDCSSENRRLRDFALMGVALIGVGVPLIVIGAKREPVPTLALGPWVSPQHGGLQLQLQLRL